MTYMTARPECRPDPDLQIGIAEARHASNDLEGGMAGERRMIVVGHRSPEDRGDPVSHFAADDSAELAHRGTHRRQRRLEARHCLLRVELGHEVGRFHDVRTQDRYELSFADGILVRAPWHSALSFGTSI